MYPFEHYTIKWLVGTVVDLSAQGLSKRDCIQFIMAAAFESGNMEGYDGGKQHGKQQHRQQQPANRSFPKVTRLASPHGYTSDEGRLTLSHLHDDERAQDE
jgi:hypothetical protein